MSEGDVPTGEYPVVAAGTTEAPTDEYPAVAAGGPATTAAHDRADYGVEPLSRSRRRTPFGIAVRIVVVVAVLAVVYYAVTLHQVWSTGRHDQARQVDAIVVLGAAQYDGRPSPQLAARLDHVVTLWPQDLAPIVVVTGGKQPADRFTEAEASARYLVERGVPEDALLFESTGRSTYESLRGVADLLRGRGLRTVLLVTDPFHALRSRLTAEELGLDAYVSPTDTSVVTGATSFTKHIKEAAGVAIGRIVGFDRLRGLTG